MNENSQHITRVSQKGVSQKGTSQKGAHSKGTQSPVVLIVEDDAALAHSLGDLLSAEGFQTSIVDSCKNAIKFLSSSAPNMIISDVSMPGKSGVDLFKETRLHSQWSDIPFIFLSGMSSPDVELEALSLGVDSFIKKPIEADELLALVNGKLNQQEQRVARYDTRLEQFRKNIIHTLSHEFRTPLVSITTGTEILLEEFSGLSDDQVKTLLTSILRGGQRLERLVDDFMTMKNIDIGYADKAYHNSKSKISMPVFMRRCEEAVRARLNMSLDAYTLHIHYELEEDVLVEVSEGQLIDVLFRLIENGIKFSGEKAEAVLDVTLLDTAIEFSVRDKGSGFPHKDFSSGTQRFIQLNREFLEQQGCGVGLSIASYYVALHRGTMRLKQPDDGVGTTIVVSIPR